MAYFNPDRPRVEARSKILPDRREEVTFMGGVFIAFQLFAIFALVRVCMLVSGVTFIRLPIVDPALASIVHWVQNIIAQYQ